VNEATTKIGRTRLASVTAVDEPLAALAIDLYGRPRRAMAVRALKILFVTSGNWIAITLIRLIKKEGGGRDAGRAGRFVGGWAARTLRREFGCFVHPCARIGPGLRLPHPNGIVIGAGA
jgi:serine O-acetyltransferase